VAGVRRPGSFTLGLSPRYSLRRGLWLACIVRADFPPREVLTFAPPEDYISINSARRRLGATACLRSSSLIFGDQAPDPDRKPQVSRLWLRRLSVQPGGGTALWVPGCLTCESEERETWTAESLRTAISIEDWLVSKLVCEGIAVGRETSAVDVSGQHPCRESEGRRCDAKSRKRLRPHVQEWDLVKRCDQPGKVLIQLESLILAQSERWRQA
jgi:hypothetical protein